MSLTNKIFLLLFTIVFFSSFAFSSNQNNNDSLFYFLNKAIETNNIDLECHYTHEIATSYLYKGQSDSSIQFAAKAYQLALQLKDTSTQIETLTIHAINLHQKGKLENAIDKYNEAISLAEVYADTILLANTLEKLSLVYAKTGKTDYPKALKLLLRTAKLKEDIKAWKLLPGTYRSISSIFKEIGDSLNREIYLMKSVDLVEQNLVSNPSFSAAVYNEAGRFYTDEKVDYKKAELYFNKVLKISEQINWKKGIAVSLCNLANVKELQGQFEEALMLHGKALQLKIEMNYVYGMINSYSTMGEIFKKQKKYKQSVEYIERACSLSYTNKMTQELSNNYYSLYKVYREMNMLSQAINNYEKHIELADSLNGIENQKNVAELKTQYETEKKEQQIEQLTTENQLAKLQANQRKLIASIIGIIAGLIVLVLLLINRQNSLKRKRNESELNQRLLRSQMNPHFIFNALGSIQNYIYLNEPDEAAKYLSNFSKLMRDILESSATETIPLEQELSIVENYLILQKIRKEDTFNFEINNDCKLEIELPPMLAQPFIENAVKHAFKSINYLGEIKVSYSTNKTFLIISVEDNGIGYNTNKFSESDHKSMAVDLTQKRLNLFKYKNIHSSLVISDRSNQGLKGTKVEIHIPIEKCLKF